MGDLVDVSSGDLITAQRQNDINDYIEDGTHRIKTSGILIDDISTPEYLDLYGDSSILLASCYFENTNLDNNPSAFNLHVNSAVVVQATREGTISSYTYPSEINTCHYFGLSNDATYTGGDISVYSHAMIAQNFVNSTYNNASSNFTLNNFSFSAEIEDNISSVTANSIGGTQGVIKATLKTVDTSRTTATNLYGLLFSGWDIKAVDESTTWTIWDETGYNWRIDTLGASIEFNDANTYISSEDDGHLDLSADISIDLKGTTKIGDGGVYNYSTLSVDGISMSGTARAWKNLDLNPETITHPSANGPDNVEYQNIYYDAYDDTTEEQVYCIFRIPDDFCSSEGTANLRGSFLGMVANESGTAYVTMGYEYWKFSPEDTVDTSGAADGGGSVNIEITNGEGNYVLHESKTGTCNTSGWAQGDLVIFRFFRDVDGTYSNDDNYTGDVLIGDYHLEYIVDSLGGLI